MVLVIEDFILLELEAEEADFLRRVLWSLQLEVERTLDAWLGFIILTNYAY